MIYSIYVSEYYIKKLMKTKLRKLKIFIQNIMKWKSENWKKNVFARIAYATLINFKIKWLSDLKWTWILRV